MGVHDRLEDVRDRVVVTPSVGRVVHYVAYGTPGGEFPAGACRAAIITQVPVSTISDVRVDLCVVNPTGFFFNLNVPYDEQQKPGSWHWPERQPDAIR